MGEHNAHNGGLAEGSGVKSLRIGFVIPYFYPAWAYGGQPRSAYELARGLAQRGHRIKVLTTDSIGAERVSKGTAAERRAIEGIEVVYYSNLSNYLAYRHRFFWPIEFFRQVRQELCGFDVLHIHELRSTLTVPAYNAARELSLPYAISPHGGLRRLGKSIVKYAYDTIWGNKILHGAAAVFAISPVEQKDACHFRVPPERIHCVPNAVELEDYKAVQAAGQFRRDWSLGEKKVLLFLGRLHWVKGADLLVRAFANVHQLRPDTHLVIAGPDDGQERQIRRLIADMHLNSNVTLTGFLDDNAKRLACADSDLLVVPSRSEVFAITALESLLCGTPVLLSSACGLYPVPDTGIRTYESESIEALSLQLEKMISYKEETAHDAELWREFVSGHFSLPAVSRKAEMVYQDMLVRA
jgi:glycosyltransferase involved in cell wall biosynthesis